MRALRLLLLLGMMLAPLGRIAMAEAHSAPAAAAHSAAGHCDEPAAPAPPQPEQMAIDCMIACAAIAVAPQLLVSPFAPIKGAAPVHPARPALAGLHPDAELPPPRSA